MQYLNAQSHEKWPSQYLYGQRLHYIMLCFFLKQLLAHKISHCNLSIFASYFQAESNEERISQADKRAKNLLRNK